MGEAKTWRDAKLPQWVKDSIEADREALALSAALAWPNEPSPEPMPFQWGDYDRMTGTPVVGEYWRVYGGAPERCIIRETNVHWKKWEFSSSGENWTTHVPRGPLFQTKRDAWLYALWNECNAAAIKLMKIRGKL